MNQGQSQTWFKYADQITQETYEHWLRLQVEYGHAAILRQNDGLYGR
jgi:hypothetical protein